MRGLEEMHFDISKMIKPFFFLCRRGCSSHKMKLLEVLLV